MLESASCIFFHVDNFLHVSPLKQCHWLFTRLWQSVSCGLDNPPGGGNLDCRWIITNIIDTSNQSVSLRDMKRKKRPNRYLIQPNTSIIFTYSSYRIVICLEINRAIYSIRSDGGTAADEMVNSLITMLEEMCKTLQTQDQISRVYVTVIAHHSEINMTYGIWQTEITNQNSSSPPSSFFSMFSKKLEDLTFQRQVNPCVLGGGDSKQWSGFEGMNMNSIVEGILFYLNILPAESCPIAVLISPGVVEVPVASITKSFAKANIPFHVLLVTLTSDTQPLGCVPEIDNLRVLAEASGGSFETVSSVTKQNLESIGQIFLRPFYACRSENYHLREYSSLLRRDAGLKLYESRLQGYQLQGLTLEHIVASRLTEGYTIIGIIAETTQNQTSTFLGTGKTCLHIKLEKHLTKVSSITYIVSFYTDKTPKDYLVRKPKGDVGISRYGTGILSIEILCKCPQRIFKDVHEESATTNILINESRAIFDYDNRISLILKIPGMPGYIPPFLSEEVENGLHQNGNTIQDVSSRQSLIFNQFLVSSDILENLCSMNHYQEGYLYLMSFSPGIALDNEKRSKLFHNLRSISPHIKLYSLSGMKWLCFSNMLSKESPHEIEIYDLYLIEIDHLEPNFLTVRFSSFGNSPRGSCDLTLETVLLNIQATLHTLQFHSIRLNRNLSLLSTALSCSSRHNQLIYCYLDPIFKFYEINLFTNRQLLQSYLSDFKNNKMCLGFQPTYTSLGSMESKIHFSCILSASPSGLQVDSLFQCCVECSNEGVFISYFLEPSYEANLHPHDPFQLTRILDIPLGQSTDLAIENLSVQLPNHEISNLLQSLLRQDTLLFDYYFAMTSVYYYRIQNSLDSLMKNPRSIKIQANYWSCLQSYSYSRKFFLPALSICDDLEPSDLDATKLNNKLVELLHISLHDLNLTHIHIIGKELLSFHADYIFCQSFESGLMIIEINSKGNDVPKSEIGTRTPTLDTKNIKPELEVLASIEASSSATTDDDDCKTPDNSDTVRTTPVIGILKRFDSQEIIDELDFDTKLQDPIENSISIHYRFVSIPLQVFSSHSQTSEIVRSFQIAPEGFASLNNSLIENPLYNQYFLDMNQQLQKYHGVNFSRIIYTNLRFNFCGKIQMSDLLRALSYCQTDTIEMEVEISYRLKKYVTNGFTDLTSAINLQLYPLTLGKYLQPILHGDYFLFVPTADRDFGIFFDNELQIYNYGIFVKIFLTHKNPLRNINKEIEIFCRDINLNNFFTDIFMEYYLLCGEDKLGDLFYTSSSDDNINIKLEIFSAGFELGTNENLRHILNTFTCELESLINYDTLSTLLILPNVSRENIVLVQHCLRSARNLCQSTYSLDFLTPPSGQGILYAEKVSQCFEEELVLLKEFEKIGLYLVYSLCLIV